MAAAGVTKSPFPNGQGIKEVYFLILENVFLIGESALMGVCKYQ